MFFAKKIGENVSFSLFFFFRNKIWQIMNFKVNFSFFKLWAFFFTSKVILVLLLLENYRLHKKSGFKY